MVNPKVSVIIPVYNVEKYVGKCIKSVIGQTYSNVEIVIVNDCTPDDSMIVIEKLLSNCLSLYDNVKILNHSRNMGLASARNTGIANASGEYILHLDSDDYLELNAVENCVKHIVESKSDCVVFGMRHIFTRGTLIEHVSVPSNHQQYINQLIRREASVCMCGAMYKRSLYIDYGILAIPGLDMGEDYSTKPRLLYNASKVIAIDEPLYNYNHTNENSYTRTFCEKRIANVEQAIRVLSEFFCSKVDYSEYKDSLNYAALSSKVLLLKNWALAPMNENTFDMIEKLHNDIPIYIVNNKIERLLLKLSRNNRKTLLRIIVKVGFKLKSLVKITSC